jgi:hypothetical protein
VTRLVELAELEDLEWIEALWKKHEPAMLGEFAPAWRRFRGSLARFGPSCPERFDVVQPKLGFTRYRLNHVSRTLMLLGTAVSQPREGIGRLLDDKVQSFGYTILAVIAADNVISVAFRMALGYKFVRESIEHGNGTRVVVYEKKP